jgi:hypothetical protein
MSSSFLFICRNFQMKVQTNVIDLVKTLSDNRMANILVVDLLSHQE